MKSFVAQEIVRSLEIGAIPADVQERLSQIRPAEWDAALRWLRRGGLALYWWSRIKSENMEEAVPKNIRGNLDEDLRQNRARLSAMVEEFRSMVLLLQDAGIPYAVLKGFALIPEYCPDPVLRNQYDFDFLVHPDSLARLDRILGGAGFIKKPERLSCESAVYFHFNRRPVLPKNLDKVFSPDLHRSFEIHTCLWQSNVEKICFILPEDYLSGVVLKTWSDLTFFSLAPEDALVFQVLHTLHHILNNQCRLSHFLELAIFLHQHAGQESIWPRFEKVVQHDSRLMEAAGVVFSLAAHLFNVAVPGEAQPYTVDRLTSASAFWVRQYGLRSALQNFTASKSSLYLHRLFVENESDWQEIRRHRLFPIQKPANVARASSRAITSRPAAGSAQFAHILRRSWFHAVAALEYAWGLPAWKRGVKSAARIVARTAGEGVALRSAPLPVSDSLTGRSKGTVL